MDSKRSGGANTWSANRQDAGLAAKAARSHRPGRAGAEGESTWARLELEVTERSFQLFFLRPLATLSFPEDKILLTVSIKYIDKIPRRSDDILKEFQMNRIMKVSILFVAVIVLFAGCVTNEHIVGAGPQGSNTVEAQQWYVLWGLVPLNTVDTNAMAGDADDYLITTEQDVLDVVINMFTSIATVQTRSVNVTK